MMVMAASLFAGCDPHKVFVGDRFPVYPVETMPVLPDISAREMRPYKEFAEQASKLIVSGKQLTESDVQDLRSLLDKAREADDEGKAKIIDNYDLLIRWGKKNQATLESYDRYAKKKNNTVEMYR